MRILHRTRFLRPISSSTLFSQFRYRSYKYQSQRFFSAGSDKEFDLDPKSFAEKTSETRDESQSVKGETKTLNFKTETKQILDIVANSLYTDKEVFLRELISNASDALEKARYLQSSQKSLVDPEKPFEIRIYTDNKNGVLTIQDYGIGMTAEELVENLGTIAKSGSKEFIKKLRESASGSDTQNRIIGQFGVGFYSAFMVGDKIEVFTQSADASSGRPTSQYWVADGSGSYQIGEAENVTRGTKIKIHLKESCKQFTNPNTIESIIRKYSNFVGFPIYLNDDKVNVIQAIWTMNKSQVTEEQYTEFYKYISNDWEAPKFKLHFSTDVPIAINALLFFPERHTEKLGFQRLEPSVNLYSRKVLIQGKCKTILPDWLRFIKGAVDSEDIPLNISRESMQDSSLIQKIKKALVSKIIKFLEETGAKEPQKYNHWYNEFGIFIKEGVVTDPANKPKIARLLRFETSREEQEEFVESHGTRKLYKQSSLDEYISRMPPEQKSIYFLNAPSRALALISPYYETFKKKGYEVIFNYVNIDHIVLSQLGEYGGRKIVSLEAADAVEARESTAEHKELMDWVKTTLDEHVSEVKLSNRILSTPAVIVDHEPAALRRLMRVMESKEEFFKALPKQKLEINPEHPILKKIFALREKQPKLAKTAMEQIWDNTLANADLLDHPRAMIPRINSLIETCLDAAQSSSEAPAQQDQSSNTQQEATAKHASSASA